MLKHCLKTISECGGKIFGGYVRDVIVPLLLDPSKSDLSFKDIDIWFPDITKRDLFIATMGQSITIKSPKDNSPDYSLYHQDKRVTDNSPDYPLYHQDKRATDNSPDYPLYHQDKRVTDNSPDYPLYHQDKRATDNSPDYPLNHQDKRATDNSPDYPLNHQDKKSVYNRSEYVLLRDGEELVTLDVILCEVCPVNDSNINKIFYSLDEDGNPIFESSCDLSTDDIMSLISSKQYPLRKEYVDYLTSLSDDSLVRHVGRINTRLLDRGWKVSLPNGDMLPSRIDKEWFVTSAK